MLRLDPDGSLTTLATTGGRPVGLALAPDGKLIVADAVKGLLAIDPDGKITTLFAGKPGEPLGFADDLDVARDGTVYFSDASDKFGAGEFLYDMLEARPHGRLLKYSPATGETTVLLKDLCFANGVALSQNEDFLLVAETYRFRIMRYWLTGEQAGKSEIFIDNLPGYPDNVTSNRHGTFWVALFTVRNEQADWLAPGRSSKACWPSSPPSCGPSPSPTPSWSSWTRPARRLDSLQDPQGKPLYAVTSAFERDGYLYLGSLYNDRIGKYKLGEEPAAAGPEKEGSEKAEK